jgi:alkylation response protein AidB-like acyl-CoA dehydrogenase
MDFNDTPHEAQIRNKVRGIRDAIALPGELELAAKAGFGQEVMPIEECMAIGRRMMEQMRDMGWSAVPHWPAEYGGVGANELEKSLSNIELGALTYYMHPWNVAHTILGPTLIKYINEPQRSELVPKLAVGEINFCQLFSEPAAGSDLAGIVTRAEQQPDGDWVINGQKVWTSYAHVSDYGVVITRTDSDIAKHKGLTMFWFDMKDPAIDVRPIRQGSGQSDFNEVYFTDLRIPDCQRMGDIGAGWSVALHILGTERASLGSSISTGIEYLIKLARRITLNGKPALEDGAVRDKIATWYAIEQGLRNTTLRSQSAISRGLAPGPENAIGKLVAGTTFQDISTYALDLLGMEGLVIDGDDELLLQLQSNFLRSIGTRLEGGTDQILRNIIGERVLGLPADMRADKGMRFSEIPKWAPG